MDHLARAFPPSARIDLAREADFSIGALQIRPSRCEVEMAGARRPVQRRVMQVLVALAHPNGEVVSQDELIRRCWGGLSVSEDAIVRCVGQLRRLAEALPHPSFEIETIAGVGYRLAAAASSDGATASSERAEVRRGRSPRGLLLAGLLAALAVAVAGGLAVVRWSDHGSLQGHASATTRPPKVAAPPFRILGSSDAELQRFTGGLQEKIVRQLNDGGLSVVEPAQAATAAYAVSGAVERDSQDIVVHLELSDLRQHVTVWSDEVRNSAANADTLQQDAGHLAAQVVGDAAHFDAMAKSDPVTVGLLVRADVFSLRNSDEAREEEWDNGRMLLARLPGEAFAHANVAVVSGFLAATSPSPERVAELKAMAAKEASAALELNPKMSFAYFARYLVYPAVGRWREREAVLQVGLKAAPQDGLLTNQYSNFLREVGRSAEALELGRQAAARRPPSANRDATLLLALAVVGREREAGAFADKLGGDYVGHPAVWNSRFEAMLLRRDWGAASALLQPGADASRMGRAERAAWLQALRAMSDGSAVDKRRAVAALVTLPAPGAVVVQPPHEIYNPGERIGMVALLGGTDEAFAMAASYLRKDAYADSSFLFWPDLSAFRRDRRFHDLVQGAGLSAYWTATGKRPDFCTDKVRVEAC
jgi:DNA-binding winged helix-turn-helix (wHTH) protein/TolB-like protein/tetratricopeptide (TPR) repeat protein